MKENKQKEQQEKRGGLLRRIILTVGVAAGALALLYLAGSFFFAGHYFWRTRIGGTDVSFRSRERVREEFLNPEIFYELEITGREGMWDVLTPAELARRCQALGERWGFSVDVLDRSACEDLGMGLFLAVAQGSALEPRFIVMRWNGGKPEEPPIALVGKGITYDSGGLAIKKSSMESMRFDMNGAAAVIGAMCAIARQKLPRNVVAAVAACENMVDAHSYRNGDVLRSMSGQTVFVRNTDAEGRLTMADAMTYCVRTFHPSELLEVAGLTGSVCSFFGSVCAAALATDPSIFDRVAGLSDITGEKYAQMPYFQEYRQQLKSPYADLDNAPAGGAGGILAGFFLESFREGTPFLHVDFGAMPFTGKASDGQPEGGTGFGVKTLYHYVKRRCRT